MSSPRDMLTEDEAKTKQCPMTFAVAPIFNPDGTGFREGGPWNCIASGCMLWRWSHQDIDGVPTGFCGAGTLPKYI